MNVAQAFSSRGAFMVRQGPKINGWPRSRAAGDGRKGSLQHPRACLGVGFYTKQGKGLLYKTLTGPVQEEASWKARAVPCVLSAGTDRCQPAVASPSVVALGSGGPRLGWHRWARSRSSPQRASSAHPPSLGSGALVQFFPSRSCPGLCHGAACLPGGIQHVPDLEQDPATLRQDPPGQDPAPRTVAVPVTSFPSPGGTGGQLAHGT